MDYMRGLAPAATDVVLRSLETAEEGAPLVHAFLRFLTQQLQTHRDYELLQAYLHVFLKVRVRWTWPRSRGTTKLNAGSGFRPDVSQVHGDLLTADASYRKELAELQQVHRAATVRLREAVHFGLCLVDLCRNAPM